MRIRTIFVCSDFASLQENAIVTLILINRHQGINLKWQEKCIHNRFFNTWAGVGELSIIRELCLKPQKQEHIHVRCWSHHSDLTVSLPLALRAGSGSGVGPVTPETQALHRRLPQLWRHTHTHTRREISSLSVKAWSKIAKAKTLLVSVSVLFRERAPPPLALFTGQQAESRK